MSVRKYRIEWLLYFGMGLLELLFYMPIMLAASIYTLPDFTAFIWLAALSLLYAVAAYCYKLKWTHRGIGRLTVSVALSLGLIASVLIAAGEEMKSEALIACGFIGTLLAWRGFAMRRKGWIHSFSSSHQFFGIMTYLFILFLRAIRLHELDPYIVFLNVSGMAAILAFLAIMNERHLRKELIETGRTKAAVSSQRRNRVMMIILSAILILLAFFNPLMDRIRQGVRAVIQWILSLFGGSETEPPATETAPTSMQPPLDMEVKEQSPLLAFIEEWIKNIVLALVVIALIVVLYFLMKRLAQYIRKLYARLMKNDLGKRQRDEEELGYEDEIERLTPLQDWSKQFGKMFKGKSVNPLDQWEDLSTNEERIRSLYRRWLRKEIKGGYQHRSSLTPKETAEALGKRAGLAHEGPNKDLASLVRTYESARYGGKRPSDEDITTHSGWLKHERKNNGD